MSGSWEGQESAIWNTVFRENKKHSNVLLPPLAWQKLSPSQEEPVEGLKGGDQEVKSRRNITEPGMVH